TPARMGVGRTDVESAVPRGQAFVAVRYGERSWVVDLARGEAPLVGPGSDAVVRIEALARSQGTVRWDGEQLSLERTAKNPPIYIDGKRLQARAQLRPGDELSVGEARMVVGLAVAPNDADTSERLIRAARLALGSARRASSPTPTVSGPPPRPEVRKPIAAMARDPESRAVVERLRALADESAPVLLTGEASSGKGVFARILHESGARRAGPYVVLRCATLFDAEPIMAALGPRGGITAETECIAL